MAALLQWQVFNLHHRVKDEQTCNNNSNSNSNNKARCEPMELCKLIEIPPYYIDTLAKLFYNNCGSQQ
jgi:hypothetical protein